MKSPQQLAESIKRFSHGFWAKARSDRPPVGVVSDGLFLPVGYLRQDLPRRPLQPEDLAPGLHATDYQFAAERRKVFRDDWMPFSAAWRAIPWLEAACGCAVRAGSGSLVPEAFVDSSGALETVPIPGNSRWLNALQRQTSDLAASCPGDCWVSPTILRGCSDVLAAMRGLTNFYCDVHDDPETLARAAARINQLLLDVLAMHFSAVGPRRGGYGHIYGYWSSQPTVVIQEDALGLCSPATYRDLFLPLTADAVRRLGRGVLFHLHTTGLAHWRDVLSVPGLAGLEITVEANGPPLRDLVAMLREVLERSRLILFVDHGFEQLPAVLAALPPEGLYVLIPDRYIASDDEFGQFVAANWPARRRPARSPRRQRS